MQQFLIVAAAHFLALLSPGPDFFLVARTSIKAGWRHAAKACLGIAIANGVFIFAAFSGLTLLRPGSMSFIAIQLAGCAYLLYIGMLFIRFAGTSTIAEHHVKAPGRVTASADVLSHWRVFGMGFLSGILNPKNALFYVSLATLIEGSHTETNLKFFYGVWMFSIVLLWDLLIAIFIGNRLVLQSFSQLLPWLERISGVMLIGLALSVPVVNVMALA
ncbi:LysE family translocator [Erwinia rhapontici]|uniref:LysE family translocator n=1 Tax=Erwinia rhapontici TaxID=55212 RepID=UPI001D0D9A94|nr:LysE family translocator [Erwinia rhapontici]UDQ82604.1 LysE family translocator [Erwinia rhapontici]